jgi:hypothetical protein
LAPFRNVDRGTTMTRTAAHRARCVSAALAQTIDAFLGGRKTEHFHRSLALVGGELILFVRRLAR